MDVEEKKCQNIFQNLLLMFEDPKSNATSTVFINELLEETPRCDRFSSLSDVREAYITKLNYLEANVKEVKDITIVDRIRKITPVTSDDEKLAIKTVNHYNGWTQDRLLSCFNTKNWIYYQITNKYERTAALVGTLALGYGGYKVVLKGARKLTENSLNSIKSKSK